MTTNYTGRRYGNLVALEPTDARSQSAIIWKMMCDCGNIVSRKPSQLVVRQRRGYNPKCSNCRGLPVGKAQENTKIGHYKWNAIDRGLEWRLSDDKVRQLLSSNCFYCGSPPRNKMKKGNHKGEFVYNGIDRIDNELDYVPFNVVSCCNICNQAKHTLGAIEFMGWAAKLHKGLEARFGRA